MRSRYVAYTLKDQDYLLNTWHVSTRPALLALDELPATKWLGLKIINTSEGQAGDDSGMVEFVARYKVNGKAERLHECSRFIREQSTWFYLDGEIS